MQIGFEVTAATPKRLRAAEDAPVAETMRGERRITQAPSTDQKKVRRQMSRKTAATFSAGECRMCEGPLIPMGRSGETMKAQCQDCGTKHELQGDTSVKRTAAQRFATFQNLDEREQGYLLAIAEWHSDESVGVTAASKTAHLMRFVDSQWVVETSTSQYGHTGMSAIARRAQSVLDTEESS